ncbi:hypothetical protein NHU_02875 [Rhodovulum sulfidophilum]|uniref:Uncharacterized protein n=1 Tax=Rhodovulum sulfidophilum TaxID=35806 RepID=A0A0D6B4I9_RHOSU|nr:hypothetical protein NHU_02875 [Rhodovulum sulfidophilum]
MGERARIWALYGDGLRPMQRGLERSFERARKGRTAAVNRPEVAAIQDWRKWITYHWDHTGLLRPIERGPESRKLSELLSDHHDLDVLDSQVAASPELPGGPELRAALRARIAARQAERIGTAQGLDAFSPARPGIWAEAGDAGGNPGSRTKSTGTRGPGSRNAVAA